MNESINDLIAKTHEELNAIQTEITVLKAKLKTADPKRSNPFAASLAGAIERRDKVKAILDEQLKARAK